MEFRNVCEVRSDKEHSSRVIFSDLFGVSGVARESLFWAIFHPAVVECVSSHHIVTITLKEFAALCWPFGWYQHEGVTVSSDAFFHTFSICQLWIVLVSWEVGALQSVFVVVWNKNAFFKLWLLHHLKNSTTSTKIIIIIISKQTSTYPSTIDMSSAFRLPKSFGLQCVKPLYSTMASLVKQENSSSDRSFN